VFVFGWMAAAKASYQFVAPQAAAVKNNILTPFPAGESII